MLKKIPLPVQLVSVILFVLFFGMYLPESTASFFYSVSLNYKNLLMLFLPFMLFAFMVNGILAFRKSVASVLGILLSVAFISNMLVFLATYFSSYLILPFLVKNVTQKSVGVKQVLEPLFPSLLNFMFFERFLLWLIMASILLGIGVGILCTIVSFPRFEREMKRFKRVVEKTLKYFFIPLLPLYVFGFLLSIQYEGNFSEMFQHYGSAILFILGLQFVILFLFYFVGAKFSFRGAIHAIRIAFPVYLTAFSTMSSMVALPLSIEAAEENTGNKPLSEMAMPILANLHFAGLAINLTILLLTTTVLFRGEIPTFGQYFMFTLVMNLYMIAISGVPGSGILLVVPLLISHFNLSSEMVTSLTTLYLLIESFGAGANSFGDGGLIMIVNNIIKKLKLVR